MLDEEQRLLITSRLHQVLRPLMLRRLKQTVASELPQKVQALSWILTTSRKLLKRTECLLLHSTLHADMNSIVGLLMDMKAYILQTKMGKLLLLMQIIADMSLAVQIEYLIHCRPSAYQTALTTIIQDTLSRPAAGQGLKGINNSMMELRVICNHPLIR